jgi:hypothetical protein
MVVLKIGSLHRDEGINCQDMVSEFGKFKVITDGCTACPHAEVGAKLFHYFIQRTLELDPKTPIADHVKQAMDSILKNFDMVSDLLKYCLFTVMVMEETDTAYHVYNTGDGMTILVHHDNGVEYRGIDYENKPPYPAYEYVPEGFFNKGVPDTSLHCSVFSKDEYKMVGIASDGIKDIIKSLYRGEFESYLINRKDGKICQLINRVNNNLLPENQWHDDISIAI